MSDTKGLFENFNQYLKEYRKLFFEEYKDLYVIGVTRMKSGTFNLFCNINNHLNESYYHSDDIKYNKEDLITKSNSLWEEVSEAYNETLEINWVQSAVYITDNEKQMNEYKDEYNYTYEIEPIDLKGPYNIEYSPLVCQSEMDRLLKQNKNYYDYIEHFVKAYIGNYESMYFLEKELDIPKSDRKEYICKQAKVIKEVK